MRMKIEHGAMLDIATPDEIARMLAASTRAMLDESKVQMVRTAQVVQLDANGNGQVEVYKVPMGMEFALRRVSLGITSVSDPSTGAISINAAGKYIEYLRAGTRIDYGQPSYGAAFQVPGAETWGDQQGPFLKNGEVFEVRATGLTANATLIVGIVGIQCKAQ